MTDGFGVALIVAARVPLHHSVSGAFLVAIFQINWIKTANRTYKSYERLTDLLLSLVPPWLLEPGRERKVPTRGRRQAR